MVWVIIWFAFLVPPPVRVLVLALGTSPVLQLNDPLWSSLWGREEGGRERKRKEMRGERKMRRVSERGSESGWWWTVDPTGTESAFWSPFVPPGSLTLDPGGEILHYFARTHRHGDREKLLLRLVHLLRWVSGMHICAVSSFQYTLSGPPGPDNRHSPLPTSLHHILSSETNVVITSPEQDYQAERQKRDVCGSSQ